MLIWIQLWPPLYAVLNYMASIYAAYDLAAAADLGSGAWQGSVAADGIDDLLPGDSGEAVVVLPGDQHPVHRLGGAQADGDLWHRAGGRSRPAVDGGRRHGSECRRGQLSMGNVSMDQIRLAPNRTSAFMSNWQNDISGNTFRQTC